MWNSFKEVFVFSATEIDITEIRRVSLRFFVNLGLIEVLWLLHVLLKWGFWQFFVPSYLNLVYVLIYSDIRSKVQVFRFIIGVPENTILKSEWLATSKRAPTESHLVGIGFKTIHGSLIICRNSNLLRYQSSIHLICAHKHLLSRWLHLLIEL